MAKQDIRLFSVQGGKALAGELSLRYGTTCEQNPADDMVSDHFQIQGPAGGPWLIEVKAEGYHRVYRRDLLQPEYPRLTVKN